MGLLQDIYVGCTENVNPTALGLPIIGSIYQVPLIIFIYLYFVLFYGPRFMKNRQPYSLKTFIQIYNLAQIALNVFLVYNAYNLDFFEPVICGNHPIYIRDNINDDNIRKGWNVMFCYFLVKIVDLFETGIFILRKKNNQVSGLHLYHHVSTLLLVWLYMRYTAVVSLTFIASSNSLIHVIMYTYYYLASLGPNVQKAILPIKRWITVAQMVQLSVFFLYITHNFWPGCKFMPNGLAILSVANFAMNLYFFYNFYQKAYRKNKSKNL